MEKVISKNALAIIKRMQQNELTESVIYEEIARFAKGEENKKTLKPKGTEPLSPRKALFGLNFPFLA